MWEKIEARLAEEFKEVLNTHCQKSAKNCRDKINNLSNKYQNVKDKNKNDWGGLQKHQIISLVC